jgi:hypothetical protein
MVISIRDYKHYVMDMIYNWTGFEKDSEDPMPPAGAAFVSSIQQYHLGRVHM